MANKAFFIIVGLVSLFTLIPFYGVLIPANVDLPEHILISKLLFEKLTGETGLNMEVSFFLAYRMIPVLFASIIAACKLLGIPLLYLPKIVVTVLLITHVTVVMTILYGSLRNRDWKSYGFMVIFALPAVVCIYSACWFIGFVNFVLAITLLIPAIFLTERFLRSGRFLDAVLVFIPLFLVYVAHPFAPTFWLIWCFSRAVATLFTRSFHSEWKRLFLLGAIFAPIFVYHFWATSGTDLAPGGSSWLYNAPFVTTTEWFQNRLWSLWSGELLKADDAADERLFAVVILGTIAFSTILALRVAKSVWVKNLAISSVILLIIASGINQKFIPTPGIHWLAYDYRFTSATYAICLAIAAFILVRYLPRATATRSYRISFIVLAVVTASASLHHLFEVRKAYARFDAPARQYMAKIYAGEKPPIGIGLPHSRWHPDGTLIRLYICLVEKDCNPDGTTFKHYGGSLYAVKLLGPSSASIDRPAGLPPPTPTPIPTSSTSSFAGERGGNPGQLSGPRGIAVDANGNIYVADTGNSRVQKFNPDGDSVSVVGSPGTGSGELKEPNGVEIDAEGNIWVVDASNPSLIKYDRAGKFEKEFKPDLGFYGPRDLVLAPNKNLYIVDQGNSRIVSFNPSTEKFSTWGTFGSEPAQFSNPTGIGAGQGLIFVADLGNDRIQVFDFDGNFVRQWSVPVWGKYVWHYPDITFDTVVNRLYVSNGWQKEILAFDINGNLASDAVGAGRRDDLDNPSALAISSSKEGRHLFVLNTGNSRITEVPINADDQK